MYMLVVARGSRRGTAFSKCGNVGWTDAGEHLPENVGDKPFELILVELKPKKAAASIP